MISEPMRSDLSDEQIKAEVMDKLLRRNCWGAKYLPLDTMVNWMGKQIMSNGKRVARMVKELAREGFLILHKGNTTASLNPRLKQEIEEYIERNLKGR